MASSWLGYVEDLVIVPWYKIDRLSALMYYITGERSLPKNVGYRTNELMGPGTSSHRLYLMAIKPPRKGGYWIDFISPTPSEHHLKASTFFQLKSNNSLRRTTISVPPW